MKLGGNSGAGRPLWMPTGNDAARNVPLRPPRGVPGAGPVNAGTPGQSGGPGIGFPGNGIGSSNVFQPTRYGAVQIANFNLDSTGTTADRSALLLIEPPDIRAFFTIRLASSATGTLGLAFNAEALSLDECAYVLSPGGVIFFDVFVPQNRMYGTAFGGTGKVIVVYSNGGVA